MRAGIVLWAVLWAAFGVPWETFSPVAHWDRVSLIPFHPHYRLRDDVLNFVFYLPFGALGAAQGSTTAATVIAAALVSGTSECLQVFATDRYPSATDVVTNVAGAIAGHLAFFSWRHQRDIS